MDRRDNFDRFIGDRIFPPGTNGYVFSFYSGLHEWYTMNGGVV